MKAPNCDNGYRLNSLTYECEDIDECGDEHDHGCEYKCKMVNDVPTCIC